MDEPGLERGGCTDVAGENERQGSRLHPCVPVDAAHERRLVALGAQGGVEHEGAQHTRTVVGPQHPERPIGRADEVRRSRAASRVRVGPPIETAEQVVEVTHLRQLGAASHCERQRASETPKGASQDGAPDAAIMVERIALDRGERQIAPAGVDEIVASTVRDRP